MNIHRKILKRLTLSSFIIALIVSTLSLSVQISQVQNKALVLAKNEVKKFIENIKAQYTFKESHINLTNPNFLSITLLNSEGETITSYSVKNYQTILQEIKEVDHHYVTKETQNNKERIIHNHLRNKFYFQFSVPLYVQDLSCHIKGLYQISDEEINDIYTGITYSIIQTTLIIFITTFLLYPIVFYLNKGYIQQSKNLLKANLEIISVLAGAVSKRDNETNAHNYRVTLYAIAFGEALKLSSENMMGLIKGAFLHDVGKIGISDSILLKKGELTKVEFDQMKSHIQFGIDIISKSKWLDDAKDVVAYHHEKYDGSGYCKNISADDIPLNARIFMICDVFDALTSKRSYKSKLSFKESIKIIKNKSGTHFDPKLVLVFCNISELLYMKIAHLKDEEKLLSMLEKKLHYLSN